MDLKLMKDIDIVSDYYPLHRFEICQEIDQSLNEAEIIPHTFFYDTKWAYRWSAFLGCGNYHRKYLMRKMVPINLLKRYHGEREAFYYMFRYHYTAFLIPPTIFGLI